MGGNIFNGGTAWGQGVQQTMMAVPSQLDAMYSAAAWGHPTTLTEPAFTPLPVPVVEPLTTQMPTSLAPPPPTRALHPTVGQAFASAPSLGSAQSLGGPSQPATASSSVASKAEALLAKMDAAMHGKNRGTDDAVFQVGQRVQYWSATHEKWVASVVKAINRDPGGGVASYDLDLKPKAAASLVRILPSEAAAAEAAASVNEQLKKVMSPAIAASSESPKVKPADDVAAAILVTFKVDQKVQYWSKKKNEWMNGVVKAERTQGGNILYDVQCIGILVRGTPPERLRPRSKRAGAATSAPLVKKVRLAAGTEARAAGTATACATDAHTARLSRQRHATKSAGGSSTAEAGTTAGTGASSGPVALSAISAGGASVAVGADAGAGVAGIEVADGRQHTVAKHVTGDRVELWSEETRSWVAAVVKSVCLNAKGTVMFYDLDVRKAVIPKDVRPQAETGTGGAASAASMGLPTGSMRPPMGLPAKAGKVRRTAAGAAVGAAAGVAAVKAACAAASEVGAGEVAGAAPAGAVAAVAGGVAVAPRAAKVVSSNAKGDGAAESDMFEKGDRVRYWSVSHSKWVPAKVTEVHKMPNGTVLGYDLNLKPRAERALIRGPSTPADAPPPAGALAAATTAPPAAAAAPAPGASAAPGAGVKTRAGRPRGGDIGMELEVGSKAQYWSKREGSWTDGIVKAKSQKDGANIYDLQTKQSLVRGAKQERLRPTPAVAAEAPAPERAAPPAAPDKPAA